jgi:hypothetical protein
MYGKSHNRTDYEVQGAEHMYIYIISLTWELDGEAWSRPRTDRSTPKKDPWCPLYRRVGGPNSSSLLDVVLQYTAQRAALIGFHNV